MMFARNILKKIKSAVRYEILFWTSILNSQITNRIWRDLFDS
jgi:hypothetical protein